MADPPTDPIAPQTRHGTVDRLCAHFAADNLETAELERRLDRAYAAQTEAELVALEQDLPELLPDVMLGGIRIEERLSRREARRRGRAERLANQLGGGKPTCFGPLC